MEVGNIVGVLIGIFFLTIVNLVAIAYSYGRVTQKVDNLDRRLGRVEKILNGKLKEGD